MKKMNAETGEFIQPVILENYDDFREYAMQAAIVTYRPEYYRGPFMDDRKRIKRVTLAAIGVRLRDLPLSFKLVIDYTDLCDLSKPWEEQASEVDRAISKIIADLESDCPLVRGHIDSKTSLGEALSIRS